MSEKHKTVAKTPETKSTNVLSRKPETASPQHVSSPIERIFSLQRSIGNQAVQSLLKSGVLQAKLKIGQPNDIYEQEADRVADAVIRIPEPMLRRLPVAEAEEEEEEPIQTKLINSVQVKRQEEKEPEDEEKTIQAKRVGEKNPQVSYTLETQINSIRGSGQPLSESVRAFFEPRFGCDFSQVRIHTDERAAESARTMNAQAFTVGRDVVFGAGHYSPETTEGKRLLAHELTHVVHQEGMQINNKQPPIHMIFRQQDVSNPLPREVQVFLDRVRQHPEHYERLLLTIAFHPNPFQAFIDSLEGYYPFTLQAIQQASNPTIVVQEAVQELTRIGQGYQRRNPIFARRIQRESRLRVAVERAINQLSLSQIEPYLIDALLVSDVRYLWHVGLNFAQNELPAQLAQRAFESRAAESLYASLGVSLRRSAEQRQRTDANFRRRVEAERRRREQERRERRRMPAPQIIWGEEVPT